MAAGGGPGGLARLPASVLQALGPIGPGEATLLGTGWQVTAYRAGDWVIRVPRTPAGGATTERQTRLYQRLASARMPVPRDARIVRGPDGAVALGLYRYIRGRPATPGTRGEDLPRALGRFLAALHAFPAAAIGDCCEVLDDLWADRFAARWERCRPRLERSLTAWLGPVIERFLADGGGAGVPPVLVHGDLGEEHVLVDTAGRLEGIIDFSGPRITDPALDFGALIERFGWPFAGATLSEYGPADPGLARRARFYAAVRPLASIELGLRYGSESKVMEGLERLAARRRASGAE
jgi:aminoglycoside phosphotransferase (APT) family kinase protein